MTHPWRSAASSSTGRSKRRPLNETSVPSKRSSRSQNSQTIAASLYPPAPSTSTPVTTRSSLTAPTTIVIGTWKATGRKSERDASTVRAYASSAEMSSSRWRTRRSRSLSIRVSMSKTANATRTMLGRGKNFHQPDGHRQPLLAHDALHGMPAKAHRLERGVERARVRAPGIGEQGASARADPACERRCERREERPVVEQLRHEDEVEACAHDRTRGVGDDEVRVHDIVGCGAGADERERLRDPIEKRDPRSAARGNEPGEPESAADLEDRPRARRDQDRKHARAAPQVRPVRRRGWIFRAEQRRAVDVPLQIYDLPERDALVIDGHVRERGIEPGDSHEAYCHPRDAVLSRRPRNGGRLMEDMVRQTDHLINFTREINRRIADSGISGVEGLVALYDQLRSALAKVSPQELEWAQGEVNRVLESLKRLNDELQHLSALKSA